MAPLRVLIIDEGLAFGGSLMVAGAIAGAMDRAGAEVTLALAADPDIVRNRTPFPVTITSLRKHYDYGKRWWVHSRFARLPAALRKLIAYGIAPFEFLLNVPYVVRLTWFLRRQRIDLVHLMNATANFEALLAALLARRRVLVHAQGFCEPSRYAGWLWLKASTYVAISSVIQESILALGVAPDNIVLLPNPLTVSPPPPDPALRSRIRASLNLPSDAAVFGIVGRVVEWKGQREFLEAASLVLQRHSTALAVIVGGIADGGEAYLAELRELAARFPHGDRVRFLGFQTDPDAMYAGLDVVVHSSIEPEPFGLVITEAMAYGIPVIASSRGAGPEIVTEGADGLVRDPREPEAVAGAILSLLEDSDLRRRMGAAARNTALERYGLPQYLRRLSDIYVATMTNGKGPQV